MTRVLQLFNSGFIPHPHRIDSIDIITNIDDDSWMEPYQTIDVPLQNITNGLKTVIHNATISHLLGVLA